MTDPPAGPGEEFLVDTSDDGFGGGQVTMVIVGALILGEEGSQTLALHAALRPPVFSVSLGREVDCVAIFLRDSESLRTGVEVQIAAPKLPSKALPLVRSVAELAYLSRGVVLSTGRQDE